MLALKEQVLSICTEREKELYKLAEEKLGGESEVAAILSGCELRGIAGPIKFSEIEKVALSKKETIHPNYLKWFKIAYLKYLLKILYDNGDLNKTIAKEFGIDEQTLNINNIDEFSYAEFYHSDN